MKLKTTPNRLKSKKPLLLFVLFLLSHKSERCLAQDKFVEMLRAGATSNAQATFEADFADGATRGGGAGATIPKGWQFQCGDVLYICVSDLGCDMQHFCAFDEYDSTVAIRIGP